MSHGENICRFLKLISILYVRAKCKRFCCRHLHKTSDDQGKLLYKTDIGRERFYPVYDFKMSTEL